MLVTVALSWQLCSSGVRFFDAVDNRCTREGFCACFFFVCVCVCVVLFSSAQITSLRVKRCTYSREWCFLPSGVEFLDKSILSHASDLQLFAAHVCVLSSLGDSRMDQAAASLKERVPVTFQPLLLPGYGQDFQRTMTLSLPEDSWRDVLGFVCPAEYQHLARKALGVSREFYWLLKNSLSCIRLCRPPGPLCGLVWLHTRETWCAPVKTVEVYFPIKAQHVKTLQLSPGFETFRLRVQTDRNKDRDDLLSNLEILGVKGISIDS